MGTARHSLALQLRFHRDCMPLRMEGEAVPSRAGSMGATDAKHSERRLGEEQGSAEWLVNEEHMA